MANTFELGGSPLGLIGVKSRPTEDGMSTFTGGDSRNVNVSSYNLGRKQTTNISVDGKNVESTVSLFTGDSVPKFWANISKFGTNEDTTGSDEGSEYDGINREVLHNNEVYDTSLINIIEKLSFSTKASLRPQDFAYLKNLGVFPNNRLMIARRFAEPQKDNIMDKGGSRPLSVLISWKPEDEDFINFNFGEKWEDAEADFTDVLNRVGSNFRIKDAGSGASEGLNLVPLPGATELLQRKFLENLGVLENTDGVMNSKPLPSGNPNIIKEAKRRKVIGYGKADSGLKADIQIKMTVEYEQKFISSIDPTIAFMDILNNALSFGTSNSDSVGLSGQFSNKIKKYTSRGGISELLKDMVIALKSALNETKDSIKGIIGGIFDNSNDDGSGNGDSGKQNEDGESSEEDTNIANDIFNSIVSSIEATIGKYKVELMGIAHALSGYPSTPWHITIGNPMRPVFCSGDMLVDKVDLKMGPTLAFNDLPSTITVDFTLKNARPLGMQEILAKFNSGYLRVVNTRLDHVASSITGDSSGYYERIGSVDNDQQQQSVEQSSSSAAPGDSLSDTGAGGDSEDNTIGPKQKSTTKENS